MCHHNVDQPVLAACDLTPVCVCRYLYDNKLSGTIPDTISKLANVVYLYVLAL
jgi:hypothetical protein